MRQVKEFDTKDGKRYRVRYRLGEQQTSQTFWRKQDAVTFAALLDGGGISAALAWLKASDDKPTSLTFGPWFEQYVKQLTGVSPRTRDDYRSMHRRYLTPFDTLPLPMLTRGHVTDLVNRMEAAGRSPKTIKSTINLLSTCLQLAIDDGHLTANPCRRVRLPKAQLGGAEARFLTHDELAQLVDAMPAHYKALVIFLVGTGLRWSEATALQGRHVNLAAGTVRVEQAWKRVPGKGYDLGPPKTPKSRRTVNPAVMALAVVRPLLSEPSAFVFTTPSGGHVSHSNFYTNVWQPACKRAKLNPPPRIHDLRHSHASWLISDGIQLEAVQDQLGHESILTTRKVYGHLLPALGVAVGKSASDALERALPNWVDAASLPSPRVLDSPDDPESSNGIAPNVSHGGDR